MEDRRPPTARVACTILKGQNVELRQCARLPLNGGGFTTTRGRPNIAAGSAGRVGASRPRAGGLAAGPARARRARAGPLAPAPRPPPLQPEAARARSPPGDRSWGQSSRAALVGNTATTQTAIRATSSTSGSVL